jgi:hypothetical protein
MAAQATTLALRTDTLAAAPPNRQHPAPSSALRAFPQPAEPLDTETAAPPAPPRRPQPLPPNQARWRSGR